jgi:2-oxoglutarate ferredoxin oxidoreductase subunit gamma
MTELKQVRLSGFGGQGIVLAGVLLGEAGVIDGKWVSGSNSYGVQARGSGCKSEIVLADGPIDFPHLTASDILMTLSQGAYDLYNRDVRSGTGIVVYDSGLVKPREGLPAEQFGVGATDWAVQELRNKQVANIVLLAALAEVTGIVSVGALEKALEVHVQERFLEINLKALQGGRRLGRQAHG